MMIKKKFNEFEQAMLDKYPVMLEGMNLPANKSCLAFGFEHGEGWYPILEKMFSDLYNVVKEKGLEDEFRILQVKEKFGTLRVYYSLFDDEIESIINFAERYSNTVCETCGADGEMNKNGYWLKVSCKEHE